MQPKLSLSGCISAVAVDSLGSGGHRYLPPSRIDSENEPVRRGLAPHRCFGLVAKKLNGRGLANLNFALAGDDFADDVRVKAGFV
jgi:hypothetical protein